MKKFLCKDVLIPVVTILFLLVYILEALRKLSAPMVDGVPQETFFPVIIFVFGMCGAISLLIPAVKKVCAADYVVPDKKAISFKPLYVFIAFALFIFLFDTLGFTICAPIFVFAMMNIFDDKPQQFGKKAIYTVIVVAFVYVLYNYVFEINFPEIWR